MPSSSPRVPKYRHHKPSGQAVVTLDGRDAYLGPYGSDESKAEYHRLVALWQAQRGLPAGGDTRRDLTVSELFLAYWDFVQTYYRKNDQPTSEVRSIKQAMTDLLKLMGTTRAEAFGPLALKSVQQAMIDRGVSRRVINQNVGRIKRMFKWAASQELVSPSVFHGLQTVAGLRRGRCGARERAPVTPVPEEIMEATAQKASRQVAAMIRLQWHSGMRPGEVVLIRPCDVDRTGEVWLYRPVSHKTEHHGRQRVIHLGPKAREVLQPFLSRHDSAYCFSPAEAEMERRRLLHAQRKTPLSCGNTPGSNRVRRPSRAPSDRYTVESYRRAIAYACDRAFPWPKLNGRRRRDLTPAEVEQLKRWRRSMRWHPHRLRHSAATRLANRYGIEAAQLVLGHSTLAVTQVYAERDMTRAAQIMGQVG